MMDFENFYAFILFAAGIFSLKSAVQGKSIESSENPKLSKKASRVIYSLTGVVLIVFGVLRLS